MLYIWLNGGKEEKDERKVSDLIALSQEEENSVLQRKPVINSFVRKLASVKGQFYGTFGEQW